MIKLIIFDFDNTLVDSLDYWYEIMDQKSFIKFQSKPVKEFHQLRKGLGNEEIAQRFIDCIDGKTTIQKVFTFWKKEMQYNYENKIKIIPGCKEFVEQLHKLNYKLILATDTDFDLVKVALKHFDLEKYFDAIYTEGIVGFSKSNPKLLMACMNHFMVSADETFMFEDSFASLKTANSIGIKTCAVINKYNQEHFDAIEQMSVSTIKDYYDPLLTKAFDFIKNNNV